MQAGRERFPAPSHLSPDNNAAMKELPLKNSDLKALVDDVDYERLNARCWTIRKVKHYPSQIVSADTEQIPLRKAVFGRTEGYPAVVHKDGNHLNCQKANLAEVPRSDVAKAIARAVASKVAPRPGKSGRLGVIHYALRDEWRVVVYHRDRSTIIGYWKDLDHAARAYDHAAELIKGSDASTNVSLGYLDPDAVSPAEDAEIRAEVEKAIQTDQPRYPRPASPLTPQVKE
jgi:hypothetical protein